MWISNHWKEFKILECSSGEKLEQWGKYTLIRPDPQVIWQSTKTHPAWKKCHAHYHRSSQGGGNWEFFDLPSQWNISYQNLSFHLKPFQFKHTGIFPEQASNWDWISQKIQQAKRNDLQVLNLFAYTGGATLAAAAAGAKVTHVDASKGMVGWAKENAHLSHLEDRPIRWIVDDCIKFIEREFRRNKHYDAIIMDPPSYGRGPNKEIWKIEDHLYPLLQSCMKILSAKPLFFLLNTYTTGLAPGVLSNLLGLTLYPKYKGKIQAEELGLPVDTQNIILPCGASGRWEN
ncbi:SAM-dependent methyltransferase [Clostridia bacterium]|nr:SAM-dependent methyltransferase [Clostridia bacterium]